MRVAKTAYTIQFWYTDYINGGCGRITERHSDVIPLLIQKLWEEVST